MGRCSAKPCTKWPMRAWRMVEMVEAHTWPIAIDACCTGTICMIDRNHCHRFACSIMPQLGSRAPIGIKWPAAVLAIWPHFNGNAQRRPRGASFGLILAIDTMFSSRLCYFHWRCFLRGLGLAMFSSRLCYFQTAIDMPVNMTNGRSCALQTRVYRHRHSLKFQSGNPTQDLRPRRDFR